MHIFSSCKFILFILFGHVHVCLSLPLSLFENTDTLLQNIKNKKLTVESTILSLRDLKKPLHHILGVVSNPIVKELIGDVLFGAFDLGRCHLRKSKFDIPKGRENKSRSTQLFVFQKKDRNEHVIKVSEKR